MASKPTKDTFNVDQLLGALAQTDRDEQAEHDAAIAAARKTYVAALRRAASGKATEADAADLRASMAALGIGADQLRRDSEIAVEVAGLRPVAARLADLEAQRATAKATLDARLAELKTASGQARFAFQAAAHEHQAAMNAAHRLDVLRQERGLLFE